MADFCHQCSIDLFGEDYGDLAGITSEQDDEDGMGAVVLCESCGPIVVNSRGECYGNCLDLKHGEKKG